MALAHVGTGTGFGFTWRARTAPAWAARVLIAFACTRPYTRLARVRGWGSGNVGGVHLHHMVVGIPIVVVTGCSPSPSGRTGSCGAASSACSSARALR